MRPLPVRITAAAAALVLLASTTLAAFRLGSAQPGTLAVPGAFAPLVEAYRKVTRSAVEVPPADVLVDGAVEGLLEALDDPYAAYYPPAEFAAFNDLLGGEFSGVGLVLEETPEGLIVVTVLPETPAAGAGIMTGERIVSVDGRDVRDVPLEVVVDLVKGDPGTEVTLGFEGGAAGPRSVTLTRARISVPNLTSRLFEDGTGYVHLLGFAEGAGEELTTAVAALADQGARGLVLDLRSNPGGLLDEAVDVTSAFVGDEVIVRVRVREGEEQVLSGSGEPTDLPLVVLINGGSASASEIVAGALQDHDRATLVGETTFGKGTVQTVESLTGGGGMKFTTAEYLLPSGRSIEDRGVEPDERVADASEQLAAARAALLAQLAAGSQA